MFSILALSGPSGIGKGYLRSALTKVFPQVADLPFVTTRPPRSSDRDDLISGMSQDAFLFHKSAGRIQQDFVPYGNQRYGIWAPALELIRACEIPCLTEVHPSQIELWMEAGIGPISVVGLVSSISYLRHNLEDRGDGDIPKRIAAADDEMRLLREHSERGGLAELIEIESRGTEYWGQLVRHIAGTYLERAATA